MAEEAGLWPMPECGPKKVYLCHGTHSDLPETHTSKGYYHGVPFIYKRMVDSYASEPEGC